MFFILETKPFLCSSFPFLFPQSSDNLSVKMMGFLQEPIFTAFVALVLSFVVAKIVSFAISNSSDGGEAVACSVNEGSVAEGVGLRVGRAKGQKRVTFLDDVVIRRIDRYEGSESLEFLDDKFDEGVYQFSEKINEQCFDDGSVEHEMVIEKEGSSDDVDRVVDEKGKSVIVEGEKIEVINDDEKEVMGFVEDEGIAEDDDDWEGIERSELEKVFAEAVNYVEYGGRKEKADDHLERLSSDVQMELYGLHKVAVEGPCGGPQPMALKVSARAKWNAWQRLGSMNQEAAMEQYLRVLSDNIPGWMHNNSADDIIQSKLETLGKISDTEHERKSELSSSSIGDSSTGQSSVEKDDDV